MLFERRLTKTFAILFAVLLLPIGLWSCAGVTPGSGEAEEWGPNPPELVDSYSQKRVWGGESWRVYVEGYDPDGDMDYIDLDLYQRGGLVQAQKFVHLEEGERKRFKGYITLFVKRVDKDLTDVEIEITIADKAGHYSKQRTHHVQIGYARQRETPERWADAGRNQIGAVVFHLRSRIRSFD